MSWKKDILGNYCLIGRGSSPRPIKDNIYFDGGQIPWIKIADATASFRKIFTTKLCVNEYGASFSRLLKAGALILAASGTLGNPYFLGVDGCIHDGWLYFYDYKGIDKNWLYYKLITLQAYFNNMSFGAAIQNINTDILRETVIEIPPLSTQRKIASILSAYDDLIENNLRRIKLLEEAAQMIYKEWFVNFRFPGYENAKFINGLPEGWRNLTMDDVCLISGGGTPSTKNLSYWEPPTVPWFTPTDLTKSKTPVMLNCENKISELGLKKSSARLMPAQSIMLSSRATIGYVTTVDFDYSTNQGFINIIPRFDHLRWFLIFNLCSRTEELISHANGSTYKEITKTNFKKLSIVLPTECLLRKYSLHINPSMLLIKNILQQNSQLKQSRDILLPKLMSGEIEV